MGYVLDTNIISALMKDDRRVKRKALLCALRGNDICTSGISYYEIKRGILAMNDKVSRKKWSIFKQVQRTYRIEIIFLLLLLCAKEAILWSLQMRDISTESMDFL